MVRCSRVVAGRVLIGSPQLSEGMGGRRSVGGIEVDGFLILPRPARQRARREKSRNLAAGS